MTRAELLKKAKPILFNTDMVKTIIEGRKTVTRRLVKPQPKMPLAFTFAGYGYGTWGYPNDDAWKYWGEKYCLPSGLSEEDKKRCWTPPYKADDILYVRETWHKYIKRVGEGEACHLQEFYGYKASIANSEDAEEKWRPSIHMPREAARIFLKVKEVRVERLQECGNGWCLDIEKEGVTTPQFPILYVSDDAYHDALREEFQKLWNATLKKTDIEQYGWEANPWVWVIEFERIKPEGE